MIALIGMIPLGIVIFYLLKWMGEAKLENDYVFEFTVLDDAVKQWDVNRSNYIFIRRQFSIVRSYTCKKEEDIKVLEDIFIKRFNTLNRFH